MKVKIHRNGNFDVTIQYRGEMARCISKAAEQVDMTPGDVLVGAYHMLVNFALEQPEDFAQAVRGFYDHSRSLDAN